MKIKWILSTIGGVLVLAFAYYAVSPVWRVTTANDALPEAKPGGGAMVEKTATSSQPDTGAAMKNSGVPGTVTGTLGHPASGTARIITTGDKNYVRYENFQTLNGPDIYVYLAKDLGAKEYVSLGRVKATEGNINYEIPSNVHIADYKYVLTWCQRFGVLFNSAPLQ